MESKASKQARKASEEASPPRCRERRSYPQLSLPEGFHSRHPAQRRTSAFYPVTSECGAKRVQAAVPCSPAGGWDWLFFFFRLSSPLSVISLLPCVSLQLFEETQEVCRNVPPQFAVYTARRTAHRPTQHSYDARYEKKKTLRACIHLSTHCHIWGFSITQF